MPTLKVVNMAGSPAGEIVLSDDVFAVQVKGAVLHTAVKTYLANQRQGTQSTLTRTEVSGGGKKPWRQKGTGRARQGSTRSPQWTHGGVALGPKPRSYRISINKKVRKLALCGAMSDKINEGKMIVVDAISTNEYKTKVMVKMLASIGAGKKSLVVLPEKDEKVIGSFSNIPGIKTAYVNTINTYDILNCDTFIVAKDAAKQIEEVYAR